MRKTAGPATDTQYAGASPDTERATAGCQTATGALTAERFELIQLAVYHDDRLNWLGGLDRWVSCLTLFLGTGAFAAFLADETLAAQAAALAVAGTGALALVFDFAGRARTHLEMKRRAYQILADLERGRIDLQEACAQRTLIFADEPPERSVVNAMAGNRAGRAVYGDEFVPVRVTWLQRRLRHLFAYRGATFPVIDKPS